jgi:hypothetical protein
MKLLIVQLPLFFRHLIPLRSIYSSQNPVLKHPQFLHTETNVFFFLRRKPRTNNFNVALSGDVEKELNHNTNLQ